MPWLWVVVRCVNKLMSTNKAVRKGTPSPPKRVGVVCLHTNHLLRLLLVCFRNLLGEMIVVWRTSVDTNPHHFDRTLEHCFKRLILERFCMWIMNISQITFMIPLRFHFCFLQKDIACLLPPYPYLPSILMVLRIWGLEGKRILWYRGNCVCGAVRGQSICLIELTVSTPPNQMQVPQSGRIV